MKERRTRGDLIEMYKIITGKEKVNVGKFFQMIPSRGDPELSHNKKIFKKRCKTNERGHFFTQRNIDNWNGRGKNVVEAKKLEHLKRDLIKRIVKEEGLMKTGYFYNIKQDSLMDMRVFYSIYQ